MPGTKAYPMLEVAKHTNTSDCWMVIDGKVYDVTPFLSEHPGGEDILIDSSGRDATREFEDVGHSGDARSQLAELLIGELREPTEEELEKAAEEAKQRGQTIGEEPAAGKFSAVAKWLLPVALVVIAVLLRKYT